MALGFRPVCHMATRRAATNVLPECGGWRGVGHRPECPPLTRRTHDTSRTTEVFAAFVTSGVGVLAAFVTWPRGALLPTCWWNVGAGGGGGIIRDAREPSINPQHDVYVRSIASDRLQTAHILVDTCERASRAATPTNARAPDRASRQVRASDDDDAAPCRPPIGPL